MNNNKKNYKVIKLNGLSGLLLALFLVGVVLSSLFIMPIYGVKFLWNSFISESFDIATIRLSQASLLWFAVLAVAYGYIRSKVCFKFVNAIDLPENKFNRVDYETFLEKIKKEQEDNEKINR